MNAPLPESVRKALESVTLDDKYALESGRATGSLAAKELTYATRRLGES